MNTVIIGYDRGTGKPQELHLGANGKFVIIEGDWLWGAFKRKAKYLTKKNGFNRDEWTLMESEAIYTIMDAVNGYDPSKGDYKSYLNTVVGNALRDAAKKIADERSVWSSMKSLDACVGDDGEGATHKDRVLDGAGLEANLKLIREPRSVVVSRLIRERKDDERAKRALLNRLAANVVVAADGDEPDDAPVTPAVDGLVAELPDNDPEVEERLDTEHRSVEAMHGEAVLEMGLAEDEDERNPSASSVPHTSSLSGFGDSVTSLYLEALHFDVAIVMQGLEPKLQKWCECMFKGYTTKDAYEEAGFTRGQWYNNAQPALQKAFKHLRYAL